MRARDTAGNYGPYSDFIEFELYSGPDIVFENGVSVFTNMASHTLRGTTDPDAEVTVNSTHVSVNGDGSFEYSLELSIGVTTLSVSAQKGGLTHNKKQRVLYDITPPTGAISSPSDGASIGGIVSIVYHIMMFW